MSYQSFPILLSCLTVYVKYASSLEEADGRERERELNRQTESQLNMKDTPLAANRSVMIAVYNRFTVSHLKTNVRSHIYF